MNSFEHTARLAAPLAAPLVLCESFYSKHIRSDADKDNVLGSRSSAYTLLSASVDVVLCIIAVFKMRLVFWWNTDPSLHGLYCTMFAVGALKRSCT